MNDLDVEAEARRKLLSRVMHRQMALSLRVAAIFITILIALPLFNLYFPGLAATNIGGFSLTWLFLGVLFFPITWALSAYFVRTSESVEASLVAEHPSAADSGPTQQVTK